LVAEEKCYKFACSFEINHIGNFAISH